MSGKPGAKPRGSSPFAQLLAMNPFKGPRDSAEFDKEMLGRMAGTPKIAPGTHQVVAPKTRLSFFDKLSKKSQQPAENLSENASDQSLNEPKSRKSIDRQNKQVLNIKKRLSIFAEP
jgi:hypothetical protein